MIGIAPAEYAERRERARAAARARGLAGLLVCSRGGGALDRYGDVFYLSGFYPAFPCIPDRPPHWTVRGHAFVVLPVDGPAVLVADDRPDDEVREAIDEVAVADDMAAAVVQALARSGMAAGEVGIVGSDVLSLAAHGAITQSLPSLRWWPADDVLERLRRVKSAAEIARLKAASRLGSRATDAMMEAARPGVPHGAVVAAGLEVLVPAGGVLYNAFVSAGTGGERASEVRSAFPTWAAVERLAAGQWFHVGLSGVYLGYYFDHARSRAIGEPSPEQIAVFEAPIAAVEAAIAAARPGVAAGELARAGRAALEARGFDLAGRFLGFGHGIGVGWDSPWLVPDDETPLEAGMVLCVERSVRHRGYYGDFEETILITEAGSQLLTDAIIRRW